MKAYQTFFISKTHSSWSMPDFAGQHLPPELSSQHPLLYHLCHRPPEHPKREQKFLFTVYTGRCLLRQVCHVEPAFIAPYAEGALWVWHSNNRMQAVHCELLCLESLLLQSSLFSFVVSPISDFPAHRSCWQASGETCEVTSVSFIFPCITSFPPPILWTAVVLVVIQHRIRTALNCLASGANRLSVCY